MLQTHEHPTVGIYTLGCKVNQYESEAIAELFEADGFTVLPPNRICDVYVINTCTVTAESDRKARQMIRRMISQNPDAAVIVTGCYAQVAPDAVIGIPGVSAVIGNGEKNAVPKIARELLNPGDAVTNKILVSSLDGAPFEPMCIRKFDRTRAYVKIEDGCESKCTYCIIPNARGSIRSKPFEDVLSEVAGLVDSGCPEIVLTGIETASYGRDLKNTSLASLLRSVDGIPGIHRVRLGSLDPSLIRPAFVEEIRSLSSLTPHFHLSMQSGSNAVLRRMKRKYNREQAIAAMQRLRDAIPNVQFTTDIIVGFPGETEEDFADTVSLIREGRFLMVHVFPYSKRAGTLAAEMDDQISEEIKHQRVSLLTKIAAEIRSEILADFLKNAPQQTVLFETYKSGYATGHTEHFLEVRVKSPRPLDGTYREVRLCDSDADRLYGELI